MVVGQGDVDEVSSSRPAWQQSSSGSQKRIRRSWTVRSVVDMIGKGWEVEFFYTSMLLYQLREIYSAMLIAYIAKFFGCLIDLRLLGFTTAGSRSP